MTGSGGPSSGNISTEPRICQLAQIGYNRDMVVRMRRNHSQTANRRSHHAIAGVRLSKCDCGELRVSHRACPHCGKYNGKVVIDVVARAKRSARRGKKKDISMRESGRDTSQKQTEEVTAAKT